MLWRTQFVTPSFAQPTPEDGKVLAFARDIQLGQLPATVVIRPEWLTPSEIEVLRTEEMEALLAFLAPGHPRLAADIPRLERVSVPRSYLSPLSLGHPLMVSPFLSPSTTWHMMHAKADAMGISQRVLPFMEWLRAATVEPQQGIAALPSVDFASSTLTQRQGI